MTDTPATYSEQTPSSLPGGPAGESRVGLPPLVVGALVVLGFLVAALVFMGISRSMGRRVVREKKPSAPAAVPKTVIEVVPDPGPVPSAGPSSVPQAAPATPKELPVMSLSGILFSESGERYALINGKIVREGAAVSGVTLKKVLPDRVELDFEGRRVIMRSP